MKTPVIETERLTLRPLTVEDAKAVYEGWSSDQVVARYMRWNLHQDIEEAKEWLVGEEAAAMGEDVYNWGFMLKENQKLIGSGGLIYSQQHQMHEIGYFLARDYWGKGLTTEAAKRIIECARDELKIKRVFATHAIDNVASGRIIKKKALPIKRKGPIQVLTAAEPFNRKNTS